jgi:DNA-binding NarL/FixJ family response regulator
MKIIIADDHPLFRTALRQTIGDFSSGRDNSIEILDAIDIATTHAILNANDDCDLVLLDLHMPGAQGFSGLVNLRGCFPLIPVAMISGSDAPYIIRRAAQLGASGFISKSAAPEAIAEAIASILRGEQHFPDLPAAQNHSQDVNLTEIAERVASLTPHQFRVFTMINEGLLNKQIAYELEISETTVKSHVKMIFKKLGVRKRTEVIILANALQIEPPEYELSRQ